MNVLINSDGDMIYLLKQCKFKRWLCVDVNNENKIIKTKIDLDNWKAVDYKNVKMTRISNLIKNIIDDFDFEISQQEYSKLFNLIYYCNIKYNCFKVGVTNNIPHNILSIDIYKSVFNPDCGDWYYEYYKTFNFNVEYLNEGIKIMKTNYNL